MSSVSVAASTAAASTQTLTTAQLLTEARTHNVWLPRPVSNEQLQAIYELAKFGPTALNGCPLRLQFVVSAEKRAQLLPLMMEGNRAKTAAAPAVALLGMDLHYFEQLPKLFPYIDARSMVANMPAERIEAQARLNAGLQIGYFIIAARSLGLDCGPMGGFDAAAVDAAFWGDRPVRTLVVCNLGYGDPAALHPRGPRLAFEDVGAFV
ncbi:malonic semialdehyde reductase [Leptothrix ochracea]|uniref:malonic semialdehyde reductase n=1 Tax=Leptothrix ochracea TaxID=735331 RepID=UPI0034E19DEE